MLQVKHLLESKGHDVFTTHPDTTVLDALRLMADKRIGALLVMRGDELVGLVSERDYARKVALQGRASAQTPVSEIMSTRPLVVGPDDSVAQCMRLCTDSRMRHLPVTDNGRLIGMVSIGDLVKAVIDDQAQEIEHLQRYIAS